MQLDPVALRHPHLPVHLVEEADAGDERAGRWYLGFEQGHSPLVAAGCGQEGRRKLLRQRGWDVTQSTLSRDLRELRLARVSSPDGARYVATDEGPDPKD